ncbi:MAG: hypothetical protein HYZ11_00530 [Candidatus Tectomicrobia bacterium]|uniref:Uncharacterized protein n=1 Tax=Tectimicrobiota bacterium TaxID=2528274 RepID=A0A932HUU5_UNCTE|nr:hypothetical protein [Candidatus Tectomicrobia bacterium]
MGAANLTGGPAGCGFGVNRGRAVPRDKWVPRDQELAGALAREDYKSEPWWAGWKRFSHAGVVSLDLLSINQDNREGGRVAKQVADLLWDLFNRHRAVLEDLNQGYPYL